MRRISILASLFLLFSGAISSLAEENWLSYRVSEQIEREIGDADGVTQEEHQGWYTPTFRVYQVSSVPTVVLVGPDGKVLSGNVPIGELSRRLESIGE